MQADAFACLLDSLNIRQAAVVSYSAGSTSAIQFALRHPDRVSALILVSPVGLGKGPIMPKPVFDIVFRNDLVYWALITYFGSSVQAAGLVHPRDSHSLLKKRLKSGLCWPVSCRSARGSTGVFLTSTSQLLRCSTAPRARTIRLAIYKTPTLVISAVDDPLALHENARALADRIPNARLLSVPDGGHLLLGHHGEVKSGSHSSCITTWLC